MTDIRTRIATIADLDTVAPLFDAYRQFYEQVPDVDRARAFVCDRMGRGESIILLAVDRDDRSVGFCQLYPTFCSVEAAPILALYDLFVSPGYRGRGAGRKLLLAAEDEARRHGVSRMDLTTARTNLAAQSLYASLGWLRDEVFWSYSRRIAPVE